jgi:hypothetical protein
MPAKGEFWYGIHCKNCKQFVPRIPDDQGGKGSPVKIVNRSRPVQRSRCDFCGHENVYLVSSMIRVQL